MQDVNKPNFILARQCQVPLNIISIVVNTGTCRTISENNDAERWVKCVNHVDTFRYVEVSPSC